MNDKITNIYIYIYIKINEIMRKIERSGRTWLSETLGPGKGCIVIAQFKGVRASSFMARSANTV